MAREYARVKVDIWIDDDIRSLSPSAQHLYFVLLTSPKLTYCGVTDWRPGRIAALANGWTAEQVREAADELTTRLYVVVDDETEEVLIRSFIRHDGLMKESRVAVSMVKAFAGVASNKIRGVIVHELKRLHAEDPSLNGWRTTKGEPGQALDLLSLVAIDPADLAQGLGDDLGVGLGVGLAQTPPNVWGSVWGSTSPAPTPAPTPSSKDEIGPRKRGTTAPDHFDITDKLRGWATENAPGIDVDAETENFLDHHRAKGSTFKSWDAAWRTWMRNAVKFAQQPRLRAVGSDYVWPDSVPEWERY
jgi:hypothetical protein